MKARSTCRNVTALLAATLGAPLGLHAQVRPDAGQTLQSIRPAPALSEKKPADALPVQEQGAALKAANDLRIPVKHWRITGATAFTTSELRSLVQDCIGKDLTLDEVQVAVGRISNYYRQHGYLLARAYLPAQDIRNGDIEIAVLEGRLAGVKVDNDSRVGAAIVNQHVSHIDKAGPVQGQNLERSLLLLNDLPGVEVRSTLQPGATVGTSDLDLKVRSTDGFDGNVDADNFGNRYTGELRAGGTLNFNSPLRRGDLFSLRASTAGSGMTYGRAAWQTPLGGSGLQAGIAWSSLEYELGEDFESLDAHGEAEVSSVWAAYPFLRSQTRNLTLRLSYDDKRLVDRIDATATDTRKSLDVVTLGLVADRTDTLGGGGITTYRLDLIGGRLDLDSQTAAIDQDVGGRKTEGSYGKLALNVSRLQRLGNQWLLYTALTGQVSNQNLDSSEKQSLGGIYGVRAYPQGESPGDDMALLNVELRWQLPGLPEVQALAFVDVGTVWSNHTRLATDSDNRRSLSGEGVGAQWLWPELFAIKGYVAWRSGPEPTTDTDREPRFWLQLAQYF